MDMGLNGVNIHIIVSTFHADSVPHLYFHFYECKFCQDIWNWSERYDAKNDLP